MFGIDFYPTPKEVIEQMLIDADVQGKYVLEPSAGSGNIVDALNERGAAQVLACEIDERLRKILHGKCDIIGDDFLKVTSEQVSHIDLIVMNPPFSAADKHILHAYEIAPEGCHIIALCNETSYKYRDTINYGKIKELVAKYGFDEYFGECFKTAERTTNVKVSCLHIWKPRTGENEFADCFKLTAEEENTIAGVMQYNFVRDIVNRYVGAVKLFDEVMGKANEINGLTSIISHNNIQFGAFEDGSYGKRGSEITRDYFKKELQKSAWHTIFSKMNMEKYVTKKVKEDINRYVERQQHIPFTMHNVFRMLEIIVGTNEHRMKQTLVEAFDTICSFSADNKTSGEKWKTNSGYMVTKRFIVPNSIETHWSSWRSEKPSISSYRASNINDITKALCYICGTNYDNIGSIDMFMYDNRIEWGQWHEWGFFKFRCYKKGTMHFEFLDEKVWEKFNLEVAKIKGWELPENSRSYKKGKSA